MKLIGNKTKPQQRLCALQLRSSDAIDIVTATVSRLEAVNNEIDEVVAEIEAEKNSLNATQASLHETKSSNSKIISNFKALITG